MKTKNYLIVVAALFLFFVYACSKENILSNNGKVSKFSINDAKTFFENSIQNQVLQRSLSRSIKTGEEIDSQFTGLTPINFTPEWSNAVAVSDGRTSSVNVPIVTSEEILRSKEIFS